MMLQHYPVSKLKKELISIVKKHYSGEFTIFFFGSRITDGSNERSDIDVGFLPAQPLPFSTIGLIKDEVDNINTLYTIDFVDFSKVSKSFAEVALKNIETFSA